MTKEMFECFVEDLMWRNRLEGLGIDLGIEGANLLKYCWILFRETWRGEEPADLVDEYIGWANDEEGVQLPCVETANGTLIWITSIDRLWEALNEVYWEG